MTGQYTLDMHSAAYSAAHISDCGRYRYELIRRWGDDPMLEWIMLNPSTADHNTDDPTIRRCIDFAKRWGYGAIVVHNLFAYRSPDPDTLLREAIRGSVDLVGPANSYYLGNRIGHCTMVAWGAHPAAGLWFAQAVGTDLRKALNRPNHFCLGTTAQGHPRHPLYVPSTTTPRPCSVAS